MHTAGEKAEATYEGLETASTDGLRRNDWPSRRTTRWLTEESTFRALSERGDSFKVGID
jgi:hypothetical protein